MLIGTGKNGPYILHADKYYNIPEGVSHATLSEVQGQAIITQRRQSAPRELGQHQGKPVVVGQGPKGVYIKWNEKYFNVPEGSAAAEITSVQAVGFITQAQEQAAKDVLATVGKYTIGRNEWGLYVSDGEVKAKFKPGVTEDEAKATDAATCAEMIKSYKAWKKKNAGKKQPP